MKHEYPKMIYPGGVVDAKKGVIVANEEKEAEQMAAWGDIASGKKSDMPPKSPDSGDDQVGEVKTNYSKMKVDELRELAKERGHGEEYDLEAMKKADLIELLNEEG